MFHVICAVALVVQISLALVHAKHAMVMERCDLSQGFFLLKGHVLLVDEKEFQLKTHV